MQTSHKGLGISSSDWAVFMQHAAAALEKFAVPAPERDEVLACRPSLQEDMIERVQYNGNRHTAFMLSQRMRESRSAATRRSLYADTREIIRTTCPRDCFDTCGIAVVKRNGVVAHVRGDPQHLVSRGKLCAKCSIGYNREWRDPQARLTRVVPGHRWVASRWSTAGARSAPSPLRRR